MLDGGVESSSRPEQGFGLFLPVAEFGGCDVAFVAAGVAGALVFAHSGWLMCKVMDDWRVR